jgi:DNA replication regulator SLD2
MDGDARAQYEGKSQALRQELKQWENDWVKTHDGKKPGRADIKANEDIGTSHESRKEVSPMLTTRQHANTSSTRDIGTSLMARYRPPRQTTPRRSENPCPRR